MLLLGRPTRGADCARSSVPARSGRRLSETLQPRQNFRQRIWYVSMLELYYHTAPALSSGPGQFSLTMQCGFGMGPRCRGGWRICPEPGCTSRRGRMVPLVVGATISRPKRGRLHSGPGGWGTWAPAAASRPYGPACQSVVGAGFIPARNLAPRSRPGVPARLQPGRRW